MDWFAVRCLFRYPGEAVPLYEERLTLWEATTFDEAIAQAEAEAHDYVRGLSGEYIGLAQAYVLPEPPRSGAEAFSLIRESDLAPNDYIDRFFDTGGERQIDLADETPPNAVRHYAIEPQDPPLDDEQLVAHYVAWCRAEHATSGFRDRRSLGWSAVHQLTIDDPDRALALLARVADELGEDRDGLQSLGADALEDLLVGHGDELIDAIEEQAAISQRFRRALGSVWILGDVSDDIAARVERAAGTRLGGPRKS